MSMQSIVIYIIWFLGIIIIGRIFILPIKWIAKLLINSIIGIALLYLINIIGASFGLHIGINIITAIIVGILGIPGIILLGFLKILI